MSTPNLRFLSHSGRAVAVDSEWAAFVNPWSRQIEMVVARHSMQLPGGGFRGVRRRRTTAGEEEEEASEEPVLASTAAENDHHNNNNNEEEEKLTMTPTMPRRHHHDVQVHAILSKVCLFVRL